MQFRILPLVSLLTATSMLMVGCSRGPIATTVYGRTSNPDRVKRGIPVIPVNWIERGGGPQADWGNPDFADNRTTNSAMHTRKELFINRDLALPLKEIDNYQSGTSYVGLHPDPDDPTAKMHETLTIAYDFQAARAGKDPWDCRVNAGPHAREPDGVLTLDEAEAMLKEWGLKRLD